MENNEFKITKIGFNPIKPKRSERAELISQIYKLYSDDFVPTPKYKKPMPVRFICVKLSHIPTKDLYYVLSVCRDKYNRGERVGSYLLWSVKVV